MVINIRNLSIRVLIIACLCFFALTACGRNTDSYFAVPESLDDVLAIAHARREGIVRPCYSYLEKFTIGRAPTTFEIMQLLSHGNERTEIVTTTDALYDIELFFYILASSYGPYVSVKCSNTFTTPPLGIFLAETGFAHCPQGLLSLHEKVA